MAMTEDRSILLVRMSKSTGVPKRMLWVGKHARINVTVRADQRQACHQAVQMLRNFFLVRIGTKVAIGEQSGLVHKCFLLMSARWLAVSGGRAVLHFDGRQNKGPNALEVVSHDLLANIIFIRTISIWDPT
jgi:hypothetical protein